MNTCRMLVALLGAVTLTTNASAAVLAVNADGTGDYPTIQDAVTAAVDGDVVELGDGTFTGAGNRDVDTQGKAITVRSASGNPAACVIDCEGTSGDPHRALSITSGEGPDTRIEGVGVTGGFAGGGGAILIQLSSPIIAACRFVANEAEFSGGAVAVQTDNGSLGVTTIVDCEFVENRAMSGGAVFSWGPVDIRQCLVLGNEASDSGGGVKIFEAETYGIADCFIAGNRAGDGGGLSVSIARGDVARTTIAANFATGNGGGLSATGTVASFDLSRCVLWGNCAGIATTNEAWVGADSFIALECSVVDLAEMSGDGDVNDNGFNAFVDPLFCDPADCATAPTTAGDYRVGASSVCLPANSPCGALIGALGEGCSGPTPTLDTSWGTIKDRYREVAP